jgi:hemoglobin
MRVFAVATMTTIALAALSGPASAQMPFQKSLYERLGGQAAIVAVVDDFVGNVAKDRRINRYFAKANVPRLKAKLVEQICAGTGGPCYYTGRDMKSVHAGMGIRSGDFNALVGDLGKTLKKFKVPKKEQGELVAILAPMQRDIVARR